MFLKSCPHPFACLVGVLWLLGAAVSAAAVRGEGSDNTRTTLGQPGYLVIEGVRDSTSGFRWQAGPGPGRHSLVWPEGTLGLPDSLEVEDYGRRDVGVACRADLSGVGGSGQLVFTDGLYVVSEPVVLADGVLELHLSGGELEVRANRILYRRPVVVDRSHQANYIFLAGLVLLIIVLMRRARQQLRKP